ncbi:hypothetical protein OHA40_30480 [Nocardia sp. NBC_00508]|uniref:hypothetical protein n=1 Tax=Nocardia sp. NBC_00508 TaxID=2975992 RepID=UPI002E7FD55C|nr:hypothetical protein [Nocardia sp. NBC_00508]WUD65874.1 hypothetical protein OHA40_30480 [Nocardia sp. NBC_00508]
MARAHSGSNVGPRPRRPDRHPRGRIPSTSPPHAVGTTGAAGLLNADAREIRELRYQFDHPFVVDSTAATKKFGIEPTPTRAAVQATLEARNSARSW